MDKRSLSKTKCILTFLYSSPLLFALHSKTCFAFSSTSNHYSTVTFVGNALIPTVKKFEHNSRNSLPLFSFLDKNNDQDIDEASFEEEDLNSIYPSMESSELQFEPKQQSKNPFAVALERVERDRERDIEIQEKLQDQREELERKHSLQVARLKLTLASTREELNEMEGRAKAFEDNSKGLQQKLIQEIEDKNEKLEKLEEEWTIKFE